MSTELQLKGDSRRRQLQRSKQYAEEHGLDLATTDQLEDIGISAFKGRNVKEGSLGKFLEAVKSGAVEPGSYLLVESLDRLSRQPILKSLSLFLDIIQSGIHLVTLIDKKVFREGETEFADLITSLAIMARAHEESASKSDRVSEAWGNKRIKAASGVPMTSWAPAWLKLSSDRKAYEVIPARASIVKQIFEDAAAGMGMYSIARRLNSDGISTFSESNGWHQSYVAKILGNRAVLGELQAGVRKEGVRVNEGEPVKNFYPAVVTDDLFYRAQLGKAQRRGISAGRKGKGFANLFAGLATCVYCGSKVAYENKGGGPKGGVYLICDNARRKMGCEALRWKYKDFEASFLAFVQELDLRSILDAPEGKQKRAELDGDIEATRGQLVSVTQMMEKTYALLSVDSSIEFVSEKLKSLEERKTDLEAHLIVAQGERAAIEAKEERVKISRDEISSLLAGLQGAPTNELFEIRAHITSRLRSIVKSLRIAPVGNRANTELMKTPLGEVMNRPENEMLQIITTMANIYEPEHRYFAVGFENASTRIVYPEYGNPLSYKIQVMAQSGIGFKVDRSSTAH